MRKLLLFTFFNLIFLFISIAQEIKPIGVFDKDTIRLGEPVQFYFSIHYPTEIDLLFPDSTYKFAPFEYLLHSYTRTKTKDGISVDSAVYTLVTFETDLIQKLSVPVFILKGADSILVNCDTQFVHFKPTVTTLTPPLILQTNTNFVALKKRFNSPFVIAGLIIIALIVSLTLLLTRKQISKQLQVLRIKRAYKQFLKKRNNLVINASINPVLIEKELYLWKSFVSKIEKKQVTSFTSSEILNVIQDAELKSILNSYDKYIYTNGRNFNVSEAQTALIAYTDKMYSKKIKQIKDE